MTTKTPQTKIKDFIRGKKILIGVLAVILGIVIILTVGWWGYWNVYLASKPFNSKFFQQQCGREEWYQGCPVSKCSFNVYSVAPPIFITDHGASFYDAQGNILRIGRCFGFIRPRFRSAPFDYLFCKFLPPLECKQCLCDEFEKEGQVTITTDKTEYEQGETVRITVKNNLDESIRYDEWTTACRGRTAFFIGKKVDDEYDFYPLSPNKCLMIDEVELQPETARSYELDLSKWETPHIDIDPGVYKWKFIYFLKKNGEIESKTIYSNEFRIKEKSLEEQPEIIKVTGHITSIGNDPFAQLAIQTKDELYGLTGEKANELWQLGPEKLQGKTVEIIGYLKGRTPPSFRTEKSIDVIDFEVIK